MSAKSPLNISPNLSEVSEHYALGHVFKNTTRGVALLLFLITLEPM
jgi:hypothetical protein